MAEPERPNGNGEHQYQERANAAAAVFGDTMDEAVEYLKQQWRDNPLAVAAAVAGIGFVVGILLGRRS